MRPGRFTIGRRRSSKRRSKSASTSSIFNDDLGYAESVVALEPQIDAAGIRVLSSASSVSAVAAAVVRQSGIELPARVTAFLAPASRYTANVGSALSLWRSVGRPVRVLVDGQLQTRVGWTETRRFRCRRPSDESTGTCSKVPTP